MLLMIDNYDSFTYTLVNYFESLDQEVLVKRNDEISVSDIARLSPQHIVISPGPCSPTESGVSLETVTHFYQSTPILGVCLGHQVIAQQFGANVIRAPKVMHGKTSIINHTQTGLFNQLPSPMSVTRYHSLTVQESSLPDSIEATAWTSNEIDETSSQLMALAMKEYPVVGVQFHPESVMSDHGISLLDNFIKL